MIAGQPLSTFALLKPSRCVSPRRWNRVSRSEPAPVDCEENACYHQEQEVADERLDRAEACIANRRFTLGIVHALEIRIRRGGVWRSLLARRCRSIPGWTLPARLHLIQLEARERSRPISAFRTNRVAQIERGIDHRLHGDQHDDDGDEAYRIAVRLRD